MRWALTEASPLAFAAARMIGRVISIDGFVSAQDTVRSSGIV